MRITYRSLASLKPYANNPRSASSAAVAAVAKSIKEFGFRQPVVVDEEGVIVVGHTRYLAARELGLKRIPVHVATDLTPAQIRAYRIADNKTAELSDWDEERLGVRGRFASPVRCGTDAGGFAPDTV
jgi:ParB-like chromosome segregation protein Spo0J